MNTISPLQLKKAAKELPPSPQIFGKLGKLLKDPDTGLDDITELVNTDSSLTAQVLRLSNSAMYSQGTSIDTLNEAINRVGFSELFKLVGMAAASQVFSQRNTTYNIDGGALWENSLASGLAMEFLAGKIGEDTQEAYTLGLLRSMGKMVIDTCVKLDERYPTYPDASELPLIEWEENNFGITNPTVAGFILLSWNFSDETSNTIQYQYTPTAVPPSTPMIYLLNIANGIAEKIGKPLKGESNYWNLDEDTMAKVGISPAHLVEAEERITQTLEEVISSVAL